VKISILHNVEGAKQAAGLTVVIDVFRAFSTACYVFAGGAEKIIPVGDIGVAYKLKQANPAYILMGERDGFIQPGFDFGNSPSQIRGVDFSGKTVVHTTSAGTQGIANAKSAAQIITGSFVNVGAIIKYIKTQGPEQVSLVCTGTADGNILDEDGTCAEYIKNALLGTPNDFSQTVDYIRSAGFADHFFNPTRESHPLEDYELCLSLDKFDFILRVEPYQEGLVVLKSNKVHVS